MDAVNVRDRLGCERRREGPTERTALLRFQGLDFHFEFHVGS